MVMTDTRFETLDNRGVGYRFDAKADIPWAQATEPGRFFGRGYLEALGFDVAALGRDRQAEAFFQDLLALCTCETFAHLEDDVIAFLQQEREHVPITRSSLLLVEEEVKHTLVFRRFAAALRAQRPELGPVFSRHYQPPPGFSDLNAGRDKLGGPEGLHYLFWLNTVFFEETTIFLYRHLAEEHREAPIHPTWLAIHETHAREEAQHVLTDQAYLEASPLSEADRDRWSKVFTLYLH